MPTSDLKQQVAIAVNACEDKKAENIAILQMDKAASAFTDYFVIASGTNPRQVQAIADEVELKLKEAGAYPNSVEGYRLAEWVLLDYVDFVIHVFVEERRAFYDLDRLWKSAKRLTVNELESRPSRAATRPVAAARRAKPARSRKAAAIGKAVKAATSRSKPAKKKTAPKKKAAARKKRK
jgi:ribosome-associated protein